MVHLYDFCTQQNTKNYSPAIPSGPGIIFLWHDIQSLAGIFVLRKKLINCTLIKNPITFH
jgi:hypothetical protein